MISCTELIVARMVLVMLRCEPEMIWEGGLVTWTSTLSRPQSLTSDVSLLRYYQEEQD